MQEVNRFSNSFNNTTYRTVVWLDGNGFFHIDQTIIGLGGNIKEDRKDIHGKMDKDAYIAWLTNALFSKSYSNSSQDERIWLMGE
jgi:hypothetical protein